MLATGLLGAAMTVLPAFADTMGDAGAYGTIRAATAAGLLVGALAGDRFATVGFVRLFAGGVALSAAGWFAALVAPSRSRGRRTWAERPCGRLSRRHGEGTLIRVRGKVRL